MLSSNKPKFSFSLTINELTNIPEINGSCYIGLKIKDGNGSHKLANLIKPTSNSNSNSSSTNSNNSSFSKSFFNKFDDATTKTTSPFSGSSSSSISCSTSRRKIHNFKCIFNYKLSCNLIFGLNKKLNLINNKYLLLKVYYVHQGIITELGSLDINLAEYLNFDQSITTKYLLNKSKVNSILNLTIQLNELPKSTEFHTQLQIEDNNSTTASATPTSTSQPKKLPTSTTSTSFPVSSPKRTSFNVPQFENKHVFGGINTVFGEGTFTQGPSQTISVNSPKTDEENVVNGNIPNGNLPATAATATGAAPGKPQILIDPIVGTLYCKILECNWDPELYHLLEYSPDQCIDDIFENKSNPYGYNLKLRQYVKQHTNLNDDDEDDDDQIKLNGLISELKYRQDLKSWKV
ncbi:hypothetical protein JA1_004054 [Spathaspora sp. JA1]|nr:hypothetical protein JA1_004054 [Spathaspora sp. JA1]